MNSKTKFNPISKDLWAYQLGVGLFLHLFATWVVKTVGAILLIIGVYNFLSVKASKLHLILKVLITFVIIFTYAFVTKLLAGA